MRQISKRLEALERDADKEIFANAFPYAIAYYLGGARHESEVLDAYARALGYNNFAEFFKACADLFREPPDSLANPGHPSARWPSATQTSCEVRL